ncbi:MAG: vitamin K epoxide reductase family protein [bacterium]|nr:vitamin K epoxide reductase family protein [bacterium]
MEQLLQIIVIIAALCGFFLAIHIYNEKRKRPVFTCPLDFDCNTVVKSDYSTLLKISVEVWGMAYYFLILSTYSLLTVYPSIMPEGLSMAVLVLTVVAFAFSIYLTAIQAFVLKQWCSWCLISASLCTIIFISVFLISGEKLF